MDTASAIAAKLTENLGAIHQRMLSACSRAKRAVSDVQLIAVTKYAPLPAVESIAVIHQVCGENRPQQLAERHELLPQVHWHLIGQLQRNKARLAVRHARMIHSVDSLKLLEAITEAAQRENRCPALLLQVNASRESAKSGFDPDQLPELWPQILQTAPPHAIEGLMTMAAETDDPESARPTFRLLRQLRETLQQREDTLAAGIRLTHLSMGMSGDFEIAIEEGATLVRIGSAVFQGIEC